MMSTPAIHRIAALNEYILRHTVNTFKIVKHTYVQDLLSHCARLYILSFRQIKGKDCKARLLETAEETQAIAYLIGTLGGFAGDDIVAHIDIEIDEIISQVCAIANGQNHQSKKIE